MVMLILSSRLVRNCDQRIVSMGGGEGEGGGNRDKDIYLDYLLAKDDYQ